jgi:Tfp pilus assembly protein PilF
MRKILSSIVSFGLLAVLLSMCTQEVFAQGGGASVLYGDVKIDDGQQKGDKPQTFNLILYYLATSHVIGRQMVSNNGRYRFFDVPNGEYELAVEVDNVEMARISIMVREMSRTDVRRDIALEWRGNHRLPEKSATVFALDDYQRSPASQALFDKAQEELKKNRTDEGLALLQQLVKNDPKDFIAWSELGTAQFKKEKLVDAEKSYLKALEEKPTYLVALMNFGKLRMAQKNFEGAIEIFTRAVTAQPKSADANLYLGESFLQVKKGSKAVGYLNKAIELDPMGKADVHLRLATLYNGAGMKDRAAAEYEKFLAKKPDYADKKTLQQYIADNKK